MASETDETNGNTQLPTTILQNELFGSIRKANDHAHISYPDSEY
ncbi:MAG: hypothetical protein VYA34_08845 [Myxococcota bacterium]|nr:hypothetical protein [Myxococcota bacterium]